VRKAFKEVLSQFYGRENVYISPKASQSIHWRTTTTFPQRGVVLLDQNKQVVSIQVFFTENQITIDNLISKIGEPDYVLLHGYNSPHDFRCDGIWGMLYIQSGLGVVTEQTTGSIKQTQFIYYIVIDKPSTFNDKHWWSNSTFYETVKWEGYNNYCASE
jgi:hypothetical protein